MSQRRSLNLLFITLILLWGYGFRMWQLADVPGGFSDEELTGIRITENIRNGTIFVFFDVGDEHGVESIYYAMAVTVTRNTGDGLLGYRLLSVWLGMLTLALLYNVTGRLLGRRIALVSTLLASGSLWATFISRTATHHVLMPLLTLLVMWAVTQAYFLRQRLHTSFPNTLSFSILGISLAIITYAHPTGFLAGLAVMLFALQLGRQNPRQARNMWWNSGYALVMALILGIPYIISVVRNWEISPYYGFWLDRPASVGMFIESMAGTITAFVYRGDTNPTHNMPGIPLTQLIEPILLIVGLWKIYKERYRPNYLLILLFFGLGLLPDIWINGRPDYRWMVILLPLLYMILGIGVFEIISLSRDARIFPAQSTDSTGFNIVPPLVIILFVVSISVNFYRVRDYLVHDWPERSDTQFAYNTTLGEVALYLDRTGMSQPTLICARDFEDQPIEDFAQDVSSIQKLEWMMHRENLDYRVADCRSSLVFINQGEPMQILLTDPDDQNVISTPLLQWYGAALPDQTQLVSSNGAASLWYLSDTDLIQQKIREISSTSNIYYARDLSGNLIRAPLPLDFEGNLTLLGADPLPTQAFFRPGDLLQLTTYWHIDDILAEDVGVFVRVHDIPQASPYTEINRFDIDTSRLGAGDYIVQVGFLTLPIQLRSHEYLLTMGVYEGLPVNQRQVYDSETRVPRGTYVLLDTPFQVQAP